MVAPYVMGALSIHGRMGWHWREGKVKHTWEIVLAGGSSKKSLPQGPACVTAAKAAVL